MKHLIFTLLIAIGMTAFGNNDELVVSGYFMNNNKVTVQVYQGNDLVLEKTPLFNYYKLKLQPGEYTVYFTDNTTTKKLYLSVNRAYHVEIDVDFDQKYDAIIETINHKINYRIIPRKQ